MSEETVKTAKTAKKPAGNKNTEIIVGSAAAKLAQGVKFFNEVKDVIPKLEDQIEEKVLKITDLENRIEDLNQDLNNKKAQNKFELELAYKTDKKALAQQYLNENSLIEISEEEYVDLETKYSTLKAEFDKEVSAATGKLKGILNAEFDNKVKVAELEYRAKEADNVASLKQKDTEIQSLKEQIKSLQKMIEDNRAAEVERAKASSIQNLNVGSATGK